jgi:sulfotransferase family protein
MKPDFIVIGAMKTGTTSLSKYLDAHPDIFFTTPKEPRYFSDSYTGDLRDYERYFEPASRRQVKGEGSTNYSVVGLYPSVPSRIAKAYPEVKLIYVVREPVDRIRSLYQHLLDHKPDPRPIERVVFEEPLYFESGRYAKQLDSYLEHFPRRQILVLSTEDLRRDPHRSLSSIYRFLGVDDRSSLIPIERVYNVASDKLRMPQALSSARVLLDRTELLEHIPLAAKRVVRKRFMRSQRPIDSVVSDQLRIQILDALTQDLRRLRVILGPDFDLWGVA